MRKSRFSEEQIIGVLKEHQAGLAVAEICRRHGISDATFYTWRSKYSGLEVSEAKRLKALEEENRKLEKLLAEQMLDVATLRKDAGKKLLTPSSRRQAVTWAIAHKGCSQRRACGLIGLAAKTDRYRSRRPDDDELRRRLRQPAAERRRFGYRRLLILLRREGIRDQPQTTVPALSRGTADRQEARRSQARARHTRPADAPAGVEPALQPRLRRGV